MKAILLLTLIWGIGAGAATPDSKAKSTDPSLALSQKLILDGLADGTLTKQQAIWLERQQLRIQEVKGRLASDGELSDQDQRQIKHKESRLVRKIEMKRTAHELKQGVSK